MWNFIHLFGNALLDAVVGVRPLSASVARNYEQMEVEKTQLLIAHHRQRVVEKCKLLPLHRKRCDMPSSLYRYLSRFVYRDLNVRC